MALTDYILEHAPSPKDPSRYKLSISGDESDAVKLVDKLGNIGGRPFPSPDRDYDWSIYIYDLSENVRKKLQSELERITREKKSPSSRASAGPASSGSSLLIKKYTFDTFVVGANTRFTYAACKAVAENPGKNYNPLFIYGGVGLGKTHLMQAVGNYVSENFPEFKIISENMQDFINAVVDSIEKNALKELRNRYKKIDLLLIDDIQFLEQSDSTQEEFFHIFNAMHEVGKQIVMTSDKPPKKLTTLEDRLKSRFEWGLTTDIKSPNLDTRKAILKRKAEMASVKLPEDASSYIAERLTSNIRELEGIINRISAYQELSREDITLDLIKDILKNIIPTDEDESEGASESPLPVSGLPPAPGFPPPPVPGQASPAYSQGSCARCAGPLNFIQQYQRWYCQRCGTYAEPMPQYVQPQYAPPGYMPPYPPPPEYPSAPPARPEKKCGRCAMPARYIDKYGKYYCDRCGEYLSEEDVPPPPVKKPGGSEPSGPRKAEPEKPEPVKVKPPESGSLENEVIGEEKENIREIRVGFFIPEGSDDVLADIIKKLGKLAEQKKFNFFIRPLFVHRYSSDSKLNFDKLAHLALTNSADIAICMEPSADSEVSPAFFREKISSALENAGMPGEMLTGRKIKESDALNLMLDIAICAKKRDQAKK